MFNISTNTKQHNYILTIETDNDELFNEINTLAWECHNKDNEAQNVNKSDADKSTSPYISAETRELYKHFTGAGWADNL